jgi:hypothetical protein
LNLKRVEPNCGEIESVLGFFTTAKVSVKEFKISVRVG